MRCVSDTGATAPISALTYAFSIGSDRGRPVLVSNSTVQREAARAAAERAASTPARALDVGPREMQVPSLTGAARQARTNASVAAAAPAAVPQGDARAAVVRDFDCKQDAEAFFAAHDSNPLSRSKETP
jgi:hypothetical protein